MKLYNKKDITPENVYRNRRTFLKTLGYTGVGLAIAPNMLFAAQPTLEELTKVASYEAITNYNNYYEFTTSKSGVAKKAKNFNTVGWKIVIDGLVNNPITITMEDINKIKTEERIYKLRCVEGWSMIIPWNGFELNKLLEMVQPKAEAKYVAFTSVLDPKQMKGQRSRTIDWPYVEGLRLDEAMHPLTIMATGLYNKPLPNQNGAPIRLVCPWKYGFKSAKAIVNITLTDKQPQTSWGRLAPREYGFYSNVNPGVDHPRWSQKTERVIGSGGGLFSTPRIQTEIFNGYKEEVGHLYEGLDLTKNF